MGRKIRQKETKIARTIKIAKILKDNGIDLSKITLLKQVNGKKIGIRLAEIKQDGVDIQKIIEENGLDGTFKWGSSVIHLRCSCKGKGYYKVTEEEKRIAENLGLLRKEKETTVARNIKIAKILKDNGVDLSKITLTKQVNGKPIGIRLAEIEQDGVDIQKIIEENGLDGNFKWGSFVIGIREAYKGRGHYKVTGEEKRIAEELGLVQKEKETKIAINLRIARTIKIAKILRDNGVDLLTVPLTKRENGKQVGIQLAEIKQDGVDIQKIIEKNGLDGTFKWGSSVIDLRSAYKGRRTYKLTGEEKRIAEELGLVQKEKEKETAIARTIKIAKILKDNGVDLLTVPLTKRENGKQVGIQLAEIEQDGVDIQKIIKENGLDGTFKWGSSVMGLKEAYKGRGDYKVTEEEKRMAEELGLVQKEKEKETAIARTLKIAKILRDNGVDLSAVPLIKKVNGRDIGIRLAEIKQDEVDIQKIIEENGLDGTFKWGSSVIGLREAYIGRGHYKVTEEEKRIAEELGLLRKEKETKIAKTIKIAKILKDNGVDLSKITLTKQVNGKQIGIRLAEIKQDGVDIQKIIEENGLDGTFKWGSSVIDLKVSCRGKEYYKVTEEEKRIAEKLGLLQTEKETAVARTLRIAKILKDNGVDLSKITLTKQVNGKQIGIQLAEIKQDGIDMQKIIEENGLDGTFKWGSSVINLKSAYNGKGNCKVTEEEKRVAEELGLITPNMIKQQNILQALIQKDKENRRQVEEARKLEGEYQEQLDRKIKPKGEKDWRTN